MLDLLQTSVDNFELLLQELPMLKVISDKPDEIGYFAQETLRFLSIAGSLRENDLLRNASIEERQISHILGRSLLEGFFWVIYLFDVPAERTARFREKTDAFKREYGKFWNEPLIPEKQSMEPADPTWSALPKPKDVSSMLAQVKNDQGVRYNYLYSLYRVSSFDTHGNSMEALFRSVFGKSCNFTTLDFAFGFDLIANHYLEVIQQLRESGEI